MLAYILRRIVLLVPVLLGLSMMVFAIGRLLPGDPVMLAAGPNASKEEIAALSAEFGLDQSIPVQYWRYLTGLLQGDWGRSLQTRGPVLEDLKVYLPATLELVIAAMLVVSTSPSLAQTKCEAADILFGPIAFDILEHGNDQQADAYESAIVRSATFDDPDKPFGAILGEITVDRGSFAVRNINQVVVGVIGTDLSIEGWDDVCDKTSHAEFVPVRPGSFMIYNGKSPVGTLEGRFPKNTFGVE